MTPRNGQRTTIGSGRQRKVIIEQKYSIISVAYSVDFLLKIFYNQLIFKVVIGKNYRGHSVDVPVQNCVVVTYDVVPVSSTVATSRWSL